MARTFSQQKSALAIPSTELRKLTLVQATRSKASDKTQVYYTRSRINACASFVIMVVIIALLIIPIHLLYNLAKAKTRTEDGFAAQDGSARCIGILLVFTLLFSAIMSIFTKAKRHEILGAAAA